MKNILKWAARNIVRIPVRSLIIGGIMFVISALVMAGLSIQAGTRASIAEARQSLGNTAVLQLDTQKLRQQLLKQRQAGAGAGAAAAITQIQRGVEITEAEKLLKSNYVIGYDYTSTAQASADITAVSDETTAAATAAPAQNAINSRLGNLAGNFNIPDFQLIGSLSAELSSSFYSGTRKLVDGRFYTADEVKNSAYVVLISKDLADANNLTIGSTFNLTPEQIRIPNRDAAAAVAATPAPTATASPSATAAPAATDTTAATSYKVEVIGIFTDSTQNDLSSQFRMLDPANSIEMPYSTIQQMNGQTDNTMVSSVTYYINDPKNLQAFADSAASLGVDTTKYTVNINTTQFDRMVGSIESISGLAGTTVIVVIIAGVLVMMLLMGMSARERKNEIGIMRALGAKRKSIAMQFVAEAVMVCILAMLIGGIVGAASSQYVSQKLLDNRIASSTSANQQQGILGGRGGGAAMQFLSRGSLPGGNGVAAINTINTKVGINEVLMVLGAGLFVCLAGSAAAVYRIMKYEPMQILANRV